MVQDRWHYLKGMQVIYKLIFSVTCYLSYRKYAVAIISHSSPYVYCYVLLKPLIRKKDMYMYYH